MHSHNCSFFILWQLMPPLGLTIGLYYSTVIQRRMRNGGVVWGGLGHGSPLLVASSVGLMQQVPRLFKTPFCCGAGDHG